MCIFTSPKKTHDSFFLIFSSKSTVKATLFLQLWMLLLGRFAEKKQAWPILLVCTVHVFKKIQNKPPPLPWILDSGVFYNDPTLSITAHEKLYLSIASNNPTKKILFIFDNDLTIDHANIRKLFSHCHPTIPQENSFLPPLQENMVFLSQKSRSPSYMCDINFVVSCITVYTGCQYVMFILRHILQCNLLPNPCVMSHSFLCEKKSHYILL